MARQRGSPDRRGMGAQSDFIAEPFMPSDEYKAQQLAMAQSLIASGVSREQVAKMFLLPPEFLSDAKAENKNPPKL
jgi:hypothetical protein